MTHFGKLEEGHKQVEFYPGQVLLALALEVDAGSREAAAMVDAAFEPYSKHFDSAPTTAFVGWHIDAWSRLAAATNREDYANFAFRQADWLLVKQIASSPIPEHVGGFGKQNDVPGFSSIVYVEALVRALRLANLYGDKRRRDRYAEAVRRGLQFCRRLQLDSIPASFFPNQEKRSGGVALKLDNLNVRCDVVQHFLTMSLAAFAHMDYIYA